MRRVLRRRSFHGYRSFGRRRLPPVTPGSVAKRVKENTLELKPRKKKKGIKVKPTAKETPIRLGESRTLVVGFIPNRIRGAVEGFLTWLGLRATYVTPKGYLKFRETEFPNTIFFAYDGSLGIAEYCIHTVNTRLVYILPEAVLCGKPKHTKKLEKLGGRVVIMDEAFPWNNLKLAIQSPTWSRR